MDEIDYEPLLPTKTNRWAVAYYIFSAVCMLGISVSVCYVSFTINNAVVHIQQDFQIVSDGSKQVLDSLNNFINATRPLLPEIAEMVDSIIIMADEITVLAHRVEKYLPPPKEFWQKVNKTL